MVKYSRSASLALLAGAFWTDAAAAHWEYTAWGMTVDQVVDASQGAAHALKVTSTSQGAQALASARVTVGPVAMEAIFGFDPKGGLAAVTFTPQDGQQAEGIKAWLIQTYGPPKTMPPPDEDLGAWSWGTADNDVVELVTDDDNPPVLTQHPR